MPPTALKGQPDLEQHLGFILAEEEALKKWFTGITVPSLQGGDPIEVGVWFRYPEGERQIKYPFIVIDLLTLEPDFDLFTSTYYQSDPDTLYVPSVSQHLPPLPDNGWGMGYDVREYLPFRIVWQVSTYARSALHDRYLTSIFTTDLLPVRPFFVYDAADGVDRRTDRIGFQAADTLETTESGTKRIFRKIYTISMLTEISQTVFTDPNDYSRHQALRVLLRGFFMDYPGQFWTDGPTTDFWEVIAGGSGEEGVVMSPGVYPLHIYRGDSFAIRLRLWKDASRTEPSDLTGATPKAQIRQTTNAASAVDITTTIVQPNFVDLALTPAVTATLSNGVWDLEITQGGVVRTVLTGDVLVNEDVTHA